VDIFAAGITLFETLTGVSPFARPSDIETIEAVRTEPLPDPITLRSDLDAPFVDALLKATSRNPAERFQSTRELAAALADGPVARPGELGELVQRLCARELERFRSGTTDPIAATGTKSLLRSHEEEPPPVTVVSARTQRHRRWPWAAAAGIVALGAAAAYAAWPRPASVVATPASEVSVSIAAAPAASPAPAIDGSPPVDEAPAPSSTFTALELTVPSPSRKREPRSRSARQARSQAKAVKPAAPLKVGYLSADAAPWAGVWVEGKQVDRTPLSRYPLPVGRHVVVFRNPDLGKEARRTVTIEEGKVHTLSVTFKQ
jgi:serine/threonine-protein kinase